MSIIELRRADNERVTPSPYLLPPRSFPLLHKLPVTLQEHNGLHSKYFLLCISNLRLKFLSPRFFFILRSPCSVFLARVPICRTVSSRRRVPFVSWCDERRIRRVEYIYQAIVSHDIVFSSRTTSQSFSYGTCLIHSPAWFL